ncbi:hypothetical protein DERF_004189 [Dermatophagoides farinae]|uniref:Uncharacterized protein n=1 Tax=Dermatophagoides farinae TaxID=6954 RepID=A0A922I3F2_DERFA|nr:hypothetical protein DERF_004189 [Dermatophagoides farinae]
MAPSVENLIHGNSHLRHYQARKGQRRSHFAAKPSAGRSFPPDRFGLHLLAVQSAFLPPSPCPSNMPCVAAE